MKKVYILLLSAILFSINSFCQTVTYYTFSASSGGTLDAMTGATTIVPASTDDAPSALQTIPFNFGYDGKIYTQFSASPDGIIKLGGTAATTYTGNNTYSISSSIFPFWTNLATGVGGSVSSVVTGTAPNRILKVQWFVTIPRSTTGSANSTMQAWLYEGSNVIEFRYGAGGNPSSGAAIGIKGATNNFISVTASANTASTSTPNENNRSWPGAGTIYQFTPPVVSACSRPTAQPTSLTLPDKTSTFIGGFFNAASGPASGYIVISSIGAFTGTLVDGVDYNSGDVIGNGKVAQSADSSTKSFTASGLNGNTQYTVTVFSYNNGRCSAGPIYNTTSPLSGSARTCTTVPLPIVASLTTTSASIKWLSVKGGNALPVTYTVDVATDNSFASPIAGSPFTVNEPDTSLNITGLTENATYYYRVKASGTCSTIQTYNFTTPCSPTAIPQVQNFDAATTPNLPTCTRVEDLQGTTTWTTVAAPKGYSGNVAQFTYNNFQYADDWLYTQGVNLTGGTAYTIGYKFGNDSALYADGYAENMEVKYGTSPVSTSMTNLLKNRSNFSYRVPQIDTVKFTPAASGIYYFGFHAYSYIFAQTPYYLYLDSIVVKPTGTTLPVSLVYFNAQRNGLSNELMWSTASESNTSHFVIERSNDGRNFINIGEVAAGGNSSTPLTYQFIDKSFNKGMNYYRLRIVDRDAETKFSDVRSIKNTGNTDFTIYPNPVKDGLKVTINTLTANNGLLTITDINGRQVYSSSFSVSPGNTLVNIDASNFKKGAYIIKVQLKDDVIVNKFTKL